MASLLDRMLARWRDAGQQVDERKILGGLGQLAGGMRDPSFRSGPEYLRGIQSLRNEASSRPPVLGSTQQAQRHRKITEQIARSNQRGVPALVSSAASQPSSFDALLKGLGVEQPDLTNWFNNLRIGAGGSPRSGTALPAPISAASPTIKPATLVEPSVTPAAVGGARPAVGGGARPAVGGGARPTAAVVAPRPAPDPDVLRFHGGVPYEQRADDVRGHLGPVTENRIGARARSGALPSVLRPFGSASDYPRPVSAAARAPARAPAAAVMDDEYAVASAIADRDAANKRHARMNPPRYVNEAQGIDAAGLPEVEGEPDLDAIAKTQPDDPDENKKAIKKGFFDNADMGMVEFGLRMTMAASEPGATAMGAAAKAGVSMIDNEAILEAKRADNAYKTAMQKSIERLTKSESAAQRAAAKANSIRQIDAATAAQKKNLASVTTISNAELALKSKQLDGLNAYQKAMVNAKLAGQKITGEVSQRAFLQTMISGAGDAAKIYMANNPVAVSISDPTKFATEYTAIYGNMLKSFGATDEMMDTLSPGFLAEEAKKFRLKNASDANSNADLTGRVRAAVTKNGG